MKNKLLLSVVVMLMCIVGMAQERHNRPRMSKEEFNQKRELFITKHAGLEAEEAAKFFPIYNECQKKKHELNGRIWKLRRDARGKELSEEEYRHILEEVAALRIQIEQVEQTYLSRYKDVLPYKKIFAVQGAEDRFQRELIDDMRHRR